MITITENITKKVVGETSLFIEFSYNQIYIDLLKSLSGSYYDKKSKSWEVPITYLAQILDEFCIYDDIELNLLKTKKEIIKKEPKLSNFKTKPFKYQEEGIKYGLTHNEWLLLDAPGLGKSLQAIYIAQELKKRDNLKHCLIICGVSALKENWKKEILKHSDLSCTILGQKTQKNGKSIIGGIPDRLAHLKTNIEEFFIITNIETLREDNILKELIKGKNQCDLVIFDEIQAVKTPTSQQAKNFLKLKYPKYKIGMTGTLITNSPLDVYVPLRWIGAERSTYSNFKYYYGRFGGDFGNILIGYKNIDVLKDMVDKYSLRRTKDLLDLPPKTIINEYVEMEPQQENFYEEIKNGIRQQVDKVKLNTANLLALTTRLRQATDFPFILTTNKDIKSAKIDRAIELAEQIISNNEKVVIFSSFKETIYELGRRLKQYNPVVVTGDVKDSDTSKAVDDFQTKEEVKLFIATHQKAGTGLTLTKASYMIFVSVPWTDANYTQAQDRIHRIGAKNNVTIYHLITKNTIDERVLEIVQDKGAMSDFIIDDQISEKGIESLRKYLEEL